MSALDGIKIEIEHRTGNVVPLLHEIQHALQRLLNTGETTVIDLMSLPMAPGEAEHIEQILGEGEICARMRAIGPSVIQESIYPGVWIVTHYNADEEIMTKLIEITYWPEILAAQRDDIRAGATHLAVRLEEA